MQLPTAQEFSEGRVNPLEVQGTGTAVDVWALGVSTYELVSGSCPFSSRDKAVIRQAILRNEILPLPDSISDECQDFVAGMLTYDHKSRPTAFMLAHHPFVRRHCTPAEILTATAGDDAHPFHAIDWAVSPLTRFDVPAPRTAPTMDASPAPRPHSAAPRAAEPAAAAPCASMGPGSEDSERQGSGAEDSSGTVHLICSTRPQQATASSERMLCSYSLFTANWAQSKKLAAPLPPQGGFRV